VVEPALTANFASSYSGADYGEERSTVVRKVMNDVRRTEAAGGAGNGGADDPTQQGGDGAGADVVGQASAEEGEERGRDRRGAEQDQRGCQVQVAGEYQCAFDREGQRYPDDEHGDPAVAGAFHGKTLVDCSSGRLQQQVKAG
jgi:hypothetical protein